LLAIVEKLYNGVKKKIGVDGCDTAQYQTNDEDISPDPDLFV
jgi:hypothetical protein